ncbi:hypothetical protein CR203_10375 [Salipaludibacillus neizhouensis]|uniref:DUF2268 domain-containing protein n=1 Tax=Salipaludibacillus neizhouensis TaxID=885475 RepID=A0A3A9KB21_9BACI|nr:DUF2268 domain-containing putative Zn-dependent protease [Salipaludibacillus neizhouensis]RKL67742.1 hypothetical protein CR203_10375 [Salipaludibacillus neizhouensis]
MIKLIDSSISGMKYYIENIPFKEAFAKIIPYNPNLSTEEWFNFLLDQGMNPLTEDTKLEWLQWRRKLNKPQIKNLLEDLQKDFSGPNVDIILFPLNKEHSTMNDLGGKNGCSFPKFILLFWHESVTNNHLQSLLIHEYHHVARIFHQSQDEQKITLIESMIMEGLAEWEVLSRLGENYQAPWTKLYADHVLEKWWYDVYREHFSIRGRIHHQLLLFGGRDGIPRWLGYQLGYYIVNKYFKHNQHGSAYSRLLISPSEFLTVMSESGKASKKK